MVVTDPDPLLLTGMAGSLHLRRDYIQVVTVCANRVAGASAGGDGGAQEDEGGLDEEMVGAAGGYSAAYAKLANAAKADRPVLGEITDPKQYMESALARLYSGGAAAAH